MNDLIIPALIVGALYLMMKKPSFVKVADALDQYDEVTDTRAHPELYIPTANVPSWRGFVRCYTKVGDQFVKVDFIYNPEVKLIEEFDPANAALANL